VVGTCKNRVRTADEFHTERDVASDWTVLSGAVSEFNACAFLLLHVMFCPSSYFS